MGKSDLEQVLDVLSKAIVRETLSYNYYFRTGSDDSLPDGVRGLLTQLAEEERVHRKLLLSEYTAVLRGWGGKSSGSREASTISYVVPEIPEFVPLAMAKDLDVKAISLPAKFLGGDNILTRVVSNRDDTDQGMFITLYDVMGHSLETTRINSTAASILGEYLDSTFSPDAEKEMLRPSRTVNHLNREFCSEFEGRGVFLTLFTAYIDLEKNRIHYTTAGHEPPMLLRENGQVDTLFNTQLVLGIDGHRKYIEHSVPFNRGDKLCIFSDGILEARDPSGGFYGRQRLSDILAGSQGTAAEETVLGVLGDLREFCSGEPLEDELTIAVICCCPGGEPVGV